MPRWPKPHGDCSCLSCTLSPRRMEALSLLARGWTNAEIAEAMAVSLQSVENHLGWVYLLLRLPSRGGSATRVRAALRYWNEVGLPS